jgi:1-acyl-sn-glycerol-3-phosphate acyltransferase
MTKRAILRKLERRTFIGNNFLTTDGLKEKSISMKDLIYTDGMYHTSSEQLSFFARRFPSLAFYRQFFAIIFKASAKAKRFQLDGVGRCKGSFEILRALENVGVHFEITGIEHVKHLEGPCVFIANHMSMLETLVLAVIILPVKKMTFIVKQSLLEYPVFKHVMRSWDPIAVSRKNPRDDLKAVLEGGAERLRNGISIIVFPQTTRTTSFDPAQFNTIGIKLAKKAQSPVVPIALLTDAWGNGKYIKDFGKIDPSKNVHFAFGKPMWIQGRGNKEHETIIHFINDKLQEWKNACNT